MSPNICLQILSGPPGKFLSAVTRAAARRGRATPTSGAGRVSVSSACPWPPSSPILTALCCNATLSCLKLPNRLRYLASLVVKVLS